MAKLCTPGATTRGEILGCLHRHEASLAMGCRTREHMLTPAQRGVNAHNAHNLHTNKTAAGCTADIRKFCRCAQI